MYNKMRKPPRDLFSPLFLSFLFLWREAPVIYLHQPLWTSSGTKPGLEKYQINSTFFRKWQIQFYTCPRGFPLTAGVLILHSSDAASRNLGGAFQDCFCLPQPVRWASFEGVLTRCPNDVQYSTLKTCKPTWPN